jgi:hypothetical protein
MAHVQPTAEDNGDCGNCDYSRELQRSRVAVGKRNAAQQVPPNAERRAILEPLRGN